MGNDLGEVVSDVVIGGDVGKLDFTGRYELSEPRHLCTEVAVTP